VVLSVLSIVFAPHLVRLFAPEFEPQTAALTVTMMRIMFIFSVATNISNFLGSIARVHEKFAITVLTNYPFTIITVIMIISFTDKLGIYALVLSHVLFILAQAIMFVLSVRKVFDFKAIFDFTNGDLKEVLVLSLPIYLSVGVHEINAIVDKILASGLPEGSISAMMYSYRLRGLPEGIIIGSIGTVMYPLMSKYAANKDFINLKAVATKAITLLCMTLLPVLAVSLYYAGDIINIVYVRGAFTPEIGNLTAYIFIFAMPLIIFSSTASMFSSAFYSMKDTKTPQIAAVIYVVFNITFNLLLVGPMGAAGLAFATTIASFIYLIVLFIQFRIKCGAFGGLTLVKNVAKCVIATAFMLPVFLVFEQLRGSLHIFFFWSIAAAVSLLVYAAALYVLKVELFIEALDRVKGMIRKNQQ
jgi:putative peptidoglycan lipid II flippase